MCWQCRKGFNHCARGWSIGRDVRLDGFVFHLFKLPVVEDLLLQSDATLLFVVKCSLELGLFLKKAFVLLASLEQLRDEEFVHDMAMELRGRDNVAVAKLKMFYKQTSSVE